jgi:phosphonoacetate hydrolase
MTKKIIICLDGCGPEYLDQSETPNMDSLAREGFRTTGQAIIPSVTNVNNSTIVTASFPETHGITSNYFLDPSTGKEVYMESSEFLMAETIFHRIASSGGTSALLTAKEKLKTLIQDGATFAETAERPSAWLVDRIGAPPDIYSIEVNHWLFRAARTILSEKSPDLLYLTTTDYANHMLAPDSDQSQWNINQLDRLLLDILNVTSDIEIVITADHGMNSKTLALDLNRILKDAGISANAIPIIKDRYVVHHQNLGGAAYIYLDDLSARDEASALLGGEHGIEAVLSNTEAARIYRLHPHRIGHLFVLADRDTVFGALPYARETVKIRSHGSLHESLIPIVAYGPGPISILPASNHEVAAWIFK